MILNEAIESRHSVRAYKKLPLAEDVVKLLEEQIALLNREGNLHILYGASKMADPAWASMTESISSVTTIPRKR